MPAPERGWPKPTPLPDILEGVEQLGDASEPEVEDEPEGDEPE